jgi:hypothetical protein
MFLRMKMSLRVSVNQSKAILSELNKLKSNPILAFMPVSQRAPAAPYLVIMAPVPVFCQSLPNV